MFENLQETVFLWTLISLCVLSGISIYLVRPSYKDRHRQNIEKSHIVIAKVKSFKGKQKHARVLGYLRKCNPYVFEEIILTALENIGIDVKRNRSYSGDGGIDGQCNIAGQYYLIQAKRYKRYINPKDVSALAQLLKPHQLGLFVHTGKTGKKSRRERLDKVSFISGENLTKLILGELTQDQLIRSCLYYAVPSSPRYLTSTDDIAAIA